MLRSLAKAAAAASVATAMIVTGVAIAPAAQAVAIGPDPTTASLTATTGPFTTTKYTATNVTVFGKGVIYAPNDRTKKYGVVAVTPGFVSPGASVEWLGRVIASHGFVTITIDTKNTWDLPASRADQMLAALTNVEADSRVKDIIDPTREGVVGWSMGGGGVLQAAIKKPSLKAGVALAPWDTNNNHSKVTVPTQILTADNDYIAPTIINGEQFYNSLSKTLPRSYAQFNGADHFFTNAQNPTEQLLVVSWLKRFVDGDSRYTQFLCPGPSVPSTALDSYQASCPL